MKNALYLVILLTLASCKKEPEAVVVEPLPVGRAHAAIMTHPQFPEIKNVPEVVEATRVNREAGNLYNHVMYTHPQIMAILGEMNELAPEDPKRAEFAKRMTEVAKVIPELQEKKEKMDATMLSFIEACGKAFSKIDGAKALAEQIEVSLASYEK